MSELQVKNKQPAAIQITAEQLLREAKDRQDKPIPLPKQQIVDKEELLEYQLTKRRDFENTIQRNRMAIGAWLKYAQWEERQNELERSRSIYERCLENDPRNQVVWLKYAEMEMKHKNVNRARNVLDRCTMLLPRVDMLWYKYTYMEELLDNIDGCRRVFERWMEWDPNEDAWMQYVKFEQRYHEFEKARSVFQRFVTAFPEPKNWLKWAKFEESNLKIDKAREIYEQLLTTLPDYCDQNVYISFAKFETRQKEHERARMIYKYAIDTLPEGKKENLYNVYTQFEKQFGDKEGTESVIIQKRRIKYEEELMKNQYNYDIWFDYLRLEETHGVPDKIRELYERAIAQKPPIEEKRVWRRYIFIWIYYAVWEELEQQNPERARQVYVSCLDTIPHQSFTFAKIWTLYCKFLVRQGELERARRVFGGAIGKFPKEKLFKDYIALELSLREFDRVRVLYEKYLEWSPVNCAAWIKYAELERMVGDLERCRGIFEIAIQQPELDMPEVLWKAYIDFEQEEGEYQKVRELYKRLLERTNHVKVHIARAKFEYEALDNPERVEAARSVFEQVYKMAKQQFTKQDRTLLVEEWHQFEKEHGDPSITESKLPKKVKKRRRLEDGGWEEYFDYVFDDDEQVQNVKLLEMAHRWKMQASSSDEDE
ncbi:hypothetical protein EDD86DRAFT_211526 [Gorgonomyces haynaldii]|nr:hypothetical protein EDD86DRAFT_211526 [Gorgonomyces haynaldii]